MDERFGDEMEKAVLTGWRWGLAIGRGINWVLEHCQPREIYRQLDEEHKRANRLDAGGQRHDPKTKIYAEDDQ